MTNLRLATQDRSLPPILHITYPRTILSYSKGAHTNDIYGKVADNQNQKLFARLEGLETMDQITHNSETI